MYFDFFNELVIEAGEPCKRSLQSRIDFKSVVVTLVNTSNCFLTMFEGVKDMEQEILLKTTTSSRDLSKHMVGVIHALSSMQLVFSTRLIQEIIHAELYG